MKKDSTLVKVDFPYKVDHLAIHPLEDLFLMASGRLLTLAEFNESFIYQDYPVHTVSKTNFSSQKSSLIFRN